MVSRRKNIVSPRVNGAVAVLDADFVEVRSPSIVYSLGEKDPAAIPCLYHTLGIGWRVRRWYIVMGMTAEFSGTGDSKRKLVDALYRKYSEALRKFLGRQRLSRDEVADIVQETYCRVHQAGNVDTIRNPKAFLFQVAHNVWINSQKHPSKRMERHALDVEVLEIASDEPSPYRSFESAQELAIVRAALGELPPRCRQAFVMNRFKDMTFSQIAAELNLSESMIEKHVSHAVAHLKKRIKGRRLGQTHRALHLLK